MGRQDLEAASGVAAFLVKPRSMPGDPDGEVRKANFSPDFCAGDLLAAKTTWTFLVEPHSHPAPVVHNDVHIGGQHRFHGLTCTVTRQSFTADWSLRSTSTHTHVNRSCDLPHMRGPGERDSETPDGGCCVMSARAQECCETGPDAGRQPA